MAKIVIVGGGFAGCQAALTAKRGGAEVTLLERTDGLSGCAQYAGLYRGNGEFTAVEEIIAMGGGDIFEMCDSINKHKIDLPGEPPERHVSVYDVLRIEEKLEKALAEAGVEVILQARAVDVKMNNGSVKAVVLGDGKEIAGDCFIEATGTMGPMENCIKYGKGCMLCFARCPTFGSRVSIAAKAGVKESFRCRKDGTPGVIAAGFVLAKESLDPGLLARLEREGVSLVPIPDQLLDPAKFDSIGATWNVRQAFMENLCMVDNGFAKVRVQMYMKLKDLHQIKGLERAKMIDPLSGGVFNHIKGFGEAPVDYSLKIKGVDNLFAAGEKSGWWGIGSAVITGAIAGYNAARKAAGKDYLAIPNAIAIGDYIDYCLKKRAVEGESKSQPAFRSTEYFERMKEIGLYNTNREEVRKRVEKAGLSGIMSQRG